MKISEHRLRAFVMLALRKLEGLTPTEFAEKMGIKRTYLSMMETDLRTLSLPVAEKAEKYFNQSMSLNKEELEIVKFLTDTFDPKILMVCSSIVEHRAKSEAEERK